MKFNCLKCGNCCRNRYLCIYYSEIAKFEQLKNQNNKKVKLIPFRFYIDTTNRTIIDVIYRIDSKPCPFLKNNLCVIDSEKFISCRKFPVSAWIDLGFFSKLGFNKLYFELDGHCKFIAENSSFSNSIKNSKLDSIFKREILANQEDHKLWTQINSKIKKLIKEKKFKIIIDYKFKKREPKAFDSVLNKWIHKRADFYFQEL